ncbi:MAG TPA: gfo/Idh/MocA family oxidoreductase [Verrucomicrobia bacterium]|nr:MAG: oxidoreductase [Lentisphaerae bacterium GWF2_57_35]HBA85290.1 gfo/Idh/MocA family oxidoreductase [Verrucomicrobiota bacterium]
MITTRSDLHQALRSPALQRRSASVKKTVRYAVIGLGHIAQSAVLPAFAHARKNSRLVALISDDPVKLQTLSRKYDVKFIYNYDRYEEFLRSGEIDAVYIALPNHMHRDYAVRAAEAGIHVLCEKPMAIHEQECREMIEAAAQHDVKLMIAYRLHFEQANLEAIELAQSGKLGNLRLFNSVFCMQAKEDNIRLIREKGGGTLYDMGVYCINAARYLFREEPLEVFAWSIQGSDPRFKEVDEATCAIMKFPNDKLATFVTSFGAASTAAYRIVGAQGQLILDPAYEYAEELTARSVINGKHKEKTYKPRDQFGPELLYFSDCILKDIKPEPSGEEGLADIKIIEALHRSLASRQPAVVEAIQIDQRPSKAQEIQQPKAAPPKLVHTESPTQ